MQYGEERKDHLTYSTRLFSKRFENQDKKEAYMDACKWLATNIISKRSELCAMTFSIDPVKDAMPASFILTVYVSLDEPEVRERHCKVCKELTSLFYVKGGVDNQCSNCKMLAYTQRMDELIHQKKVYYGVRLKGMLYK